jgi:phosphoribosylformimino-5-aminoimidazole carboxamide ribotide isomerase
VRAAVTALAHRGVDAQVGGGVRHRDAAQALIDAGAAYVVIGSLAVRDPGAAQALCAALPHRVLAGLDVSHGSARAQGWTVDAGAATIHLERWRSWPLAGVVHTSIERDGTLGGPALDSLRAVCLAFPGDVIASGGVTTLDDVAACESAGAAGAIVGRALHDGVFDLRAALERFGGAGRS